MSKNWNLEEHILDHAETVINNLPDTFNIENPRNVHYTISIDIAQLIMNHRCINQKDIDKVMNGFLNDLKDHSYAFDDPMGSGRKPMRRVLDLSQALIAYHNDASDSINSQNYSVNPHFHFLIPGQLKNKDGKSTKLGSGYKHLDRFIKEVAKKHNLVFNNNEAVSYDKDNFTRKGASSLTWFLKRANDTYFENKVNDKSILKAVDNFEKNYKKTGNLQYYIKGMRDLEERLKRFDLDLFNKDGVNLKDDYPIFIDIDDKEINILQSEDTEAIRVLLKDRDNRLARALVEYSYGFDNIVIDELQSRGLYLQRLDKEVLKDLTVEIKQKETKKDKYEKSLGYFVKQDIEQVLKFAKNEIHFKELMEELGYKDIKMKAKTINGSRQRVGFTYINPHNNKEANIYFNKLKMSYSDFKKHFIENSKNVNLKQKKFKYKTDSYIVKYIPLEDDENYKKKKQAFQNKVFRKIYHFDSSVDLTGFYINESTKEFISKGTVIKDKGHKLTITKQNSEDMQRNVKILLDMARAKGWNLDALVVTGTDEFKSAVLDEIKDIQSKPLELEKTEDEFKYEDLKTSNTTKTPLQ